MMLDRLDQMLQPLMRAFEEDAADSSTISAILQIGAARGAAWPLRSVRRRASFEDPESRTGRMLAAAVAQITADRPVLRPDAPIPL
jgi:hypothetical protein